MRHKDLRPWFEYFKMLQTYEQKGFLEMKPDAHEAYITHSALFAVTEGNNPRRQVRTIVSDTVLNLRSYAAFLTHQSGMGYYNHPFAVHVVKEDIPHDLLYTLLITRRRVWWKLWMKVNQIEMINYTGDEE